MRSKILLRIISGFLLSAAILIQVAEMPAHAGEPGELPLIRFGFTLGTMGTINENDAKAAIRIWIQSLTEEIGEPAITHVDFYASLREIEAGLREHRVDCVYITTKEIFALQNYLDREYLLAAERSGSMTEEYVLLAHRNKGADGINGMSGHSLVMLETDSTVIAPYWLDCFLHGNKLGRPDEFFQSIVTVKKLNKAILPVFFKQVDACLVTRSGFSIMAELNPQISRQLEIISASPPYIPTAFCFRKDFESVYKDAILRDAGTWLKFKSGRQVLTIFHLDNVKTASFDTLDPTFSLLKEHCLMSGCGGLPEGKAIP